MNWEQLKAIIWLRWRLTSNQFARAGALNAVLSILFASLLGMAAIGLAIGGFLLGLFVAGKAAPWVLLTIWDAAVVIFLIMWLSGLMIELQRSESIDLNRLLHLPITLNQVFVFNYAVSHLTPSLILFVPAMLTFSLGLVFSVGPSMVLLIPLVLAFIFMITSWTYCLRGWLAALMMNKRRRRAIIVWITILLVLVGQLPNLIFNSRHFRGHRRSRPQQQQTPSPVPGQKDELILPETLIQAHLVFPPGWIGYGTMALKEHRFLPALTATLAAGLLATLGLLRAYRVTLRFYLASDPGERPKAGSPAAAAPGASQKAGPQLQPQPRTLLLVERRLPWVPEDTSALALALFRSLLRAPELKMVAIMPVMIGVVVFMMHQNMPKGKFPQPLTGFAAAAAVALACFSFSQPMSNAFGLDRNGFRTLVLLPTQRHQILFAKNLAFFPFIAFIAAALVLLAQLLVHMPWPTLLSAVFQLPTAFLLFSLLANLSSILVPYRISQTLKAKKPKAIVILAIFLSMLLTPVVMMPVLVSPALQLLASKAGWPPAIPVSLLASAAIFAAVVGLYRLLLPLEGELFHHREQTILREVTEEVE